MTTIKEMMTFDPNAPRDMSQLRIGGFVVLRRHLPGTPHTLYLTMEGGKIAGKQISFPCEGDCASHVRTFLASSHERTHTRVQAPAFNERLSITERMVNLLKISSMDLTELAEAMNTAATVLSPILTRLINSRRVYRSGRQGNYTYSAH